MEKLNMHSPNLTQDNITRIRDLFPSCVTEAQGEDGKLKLVVDFDQLRQELSESLAEGAQERYHLNWPGKQQALVTANAPISKTMRPYREESVNFDTTQNLFIEGDNLEALKLLQETYLGKVKLIYIDPPYNTGKDFIYSDNFGVDEQQYSLRDSSKDGEGNRLIDEERWKQNSSSKGRYHSDWMSMIYSRLKLAKNLLSEDGMIFISIDEIEHANLRKIASEIFGEENFAGDIIWKNSSKNDQDYISMQHEYILCFVKSKSSNKGEWKEKKEGLDEIYQMFDGLRKEYGDNWGEIHKQALKWFNQYPESNPIYDSKHYSWMDEEGVYFPDNISGPNVGQYVYDVKHAITKKIVKPPSRGWFCPENTMLDLIEKNRVHFGTDESTVPCLKTYLKNTENKSLTSMVYKDGRAASKRLTALFDSNVFTNPKDETVLLKLFKAVGLKGNDVVLDFFAGSATTAHALMLFNAELKSTCRHILVQMPEDFNSLHATAVGVNKKITKNAIEYLTKKGHPLNICEISKERLRLAGKTISELVENQAVDTGFRVLKVAASNMADVYYAPDALDKNNLGLFVDNIKPDRTPEDLLFQVMLDWGVDLALPIDKQTIQGKEVFFIDGNVLAACFDASGSIDEAFVKELAKHEPLRVVFRDAGFKDSAVKINVDQIFKLLSPTTEVKCI